MEQRGASTKMVLNKRGMFFTLLAIVLVSVFIVSYTIVSNLSERKIVQKRVDTLSDFVSLSEEDLSRKIYISGYRIIFLLEKEILETGEFIDDVDSSFQEAFFNGSLGGVQQDLMTGATLSDILYYPEFGLVEKAAKINADVDLANPTISVSQEDPWNVKIVFTADIFIEDKSDLALWNKTLTVVSYVPIQNFGDPFYAVNTNSLVFNNFTKTPYSSFVSGSDVSNLLQHATSSYYFASTNAPSFLNRLEGSSVADANGIESLVNLAELSSKGISVQQKSVVDYIYFSSSNPGSCTVSPAGMPSWFRLDSNHTSVYQVSCA